MSESTQHIELLNRIVYYIKVNFGELYSLAVIHDLPTVIRGEKPPRIGGFSPDVYAVDVPVTTTIIGEAKTAQDLETEHSRNQLAAFIGHLCLQPKGMLIVAVPWQYTGAAQRITRRLMNTSKCRSPVQIIILDEIGEYKT